MTNRKLLFLCFFAFVLLTSALAGPTTGGKKVRKLSKKAPVFQKTESSSAKSEVFDTTRALIKTASALARSHSTSEVLTLNLTNLLILVVLKAIIFGIGLFYFGGVSFKGGHDHHGWGRALDGSGQKLESSKNSSLITQSELLLMLTYVLGSASGDNYDCMYRVACEDPAKAKEYLNASNMVLKGAKYAKKFLSYNPKYEDIVRGLHDAVSHKNSGGDCRARYVCTDVPNL